MNSLMPSLVNPSAFTAYIPSAAFGTLPSFRVPAVQAYPTPPSVPVPSPLVTAPLTVAMQRPSANFLPAVPVVKGGLEAKQAAQMFYWATHRLGGLEPDAVKAIFQAVHQTGEYTAFEAAVAETWQAKGEVSLTPLQVVQQRCVGNPLAAFFKQAQLKDLQAAYQAGNDINPLVTGLERFKFGLYQCIADFSAQVYRHPLVSVPVIGTVAFLGHSFPVLGAVAALSIMGASVTGLGRAAFSLRFKPLTPQAKAEAQTQLGANAMGLGMTLLGAEGILETLGQVKQVVKASNGLGVLPKLKQVLGIKFVHKPTEATGGFLKQALFVTGLFDDVLLPFNELAEKRKKQAPVTAQQFLI